MDNILTRIANFLGENIHQGRVVNGGDIAQASILETSSGKKYFFKTASHKGMFPKEANSLNELRKANAIKTPEVIYADNDCLLLEWIDTGRKRNDFFEQFGEKIAKLHKSTTINYGFYENNFIGSTPQLNLPTETEKTNWATFYWNKRLLPQYKITERKGINTTKLTQGFALLENKIESILGNITSPPSLLHGDLWSGNYIVSNRSEPILVDPAVYYGHREADLAMTHLFGGFAPEFYTTYNQVFPIEAGDKYRSNIYALYHVLNHLNLFGLSYLSQAERIVWGYLH